MFVGREEYLKDLNDFWGRDSGVLVTCRGRRRIGKSTLIEEFASTSAERFYSIDGLAPHKRMTDELQRRHFCEKVAEYAGRAFKMACTWSEAFAQLDEILSGRMRTVVLLDEISWLGGYNPDFAGYLKEAWDKKLRKHPNLIFVLCGSVSAWIAENILDSTGFVGRDSLDLEIKELSLSDSVKVMGAERLSVAEKLDLLSITGGVPKYLEEMRPQLTVEENMRRTCFQPRGILFREFDETFSSVFGRRTATRGRILRMLANGPRSAAELAVDDGKEANGSYAKALKDLRYAGFISGDSGLNPMTGEPLRQERFRISDNYTRFYLRYVEPKKPAIANGIFKFTSIEQLHGWEGVLGLQFENLVLNHVTDLFPLLGLDHTLVLSAAPYTQNATKERPGCQIDLLIQTQRTLMVVEIKRRREIGHSVMDEVSEKVRRLGRRKGMSVRTALIYAGDLAKSVPAEGYFDFIVPAESLFT